MDDSEKVFDEFVSLAVNFLIENHEFDSFRLQDPLDEVEPKPTDAVPMGNHNFRDRSFVREFQNGFKTLALEVESRPDIRDNFVVWEAFLHVLDLSLEVFLLPGRRDAAVSDFSRRLVGPICVEEPVDGIHALSPGASDGFDLSGLFPSPERRGIHPQNLPSPERRQVHRTIHVPAHILYRVE